MYLIPANIHSVEFEVKKSRFIATANFASNRDEAMKLVTKLSGNYPDASHHCWAYLLGPSSAPTSAAMSDDGEPSGIAGKPILNVLQHKDVGNVMLVVTRYFGGVRLGAGGLARAYSAAAQSVMESLPTTQFVEKSRLKLQIDFSQEQDLRYWLNQQLGEIINISYNEKVSCTIELPRDAVDSFIEISNRKDWELLKNELATFLDH